ncbi:hypothetical protein BB561_000311 [Smittium simulii]|uniref:Uncharacterized protein n=1 Tax=Smittium simulii TaxID=133385 RepID=A0A2T9YZL5_9FUNG|nr:hypothetical protein BB561_000323 [Smittium simulii]PVU97786.1 hypothetical protein BB561_000311 [Smittium simulii]
MINQGLVYGVTHIFPVITVGNDEGSSLVYVLQKSSNFIILRLRRNEKVNTNEIITSMTNNIKL